MPSRLLQPSALRQTWPCVSRQTLRRSLSTGKTSPTAPQKSYMASLMAKLRQKHPNIAPASLITSFLVLHELTAVLPLFAVFGALHHLDAGEVVLEHMQSWSNGTAAESWIGEAQAKAGRMVKRGYFIDKSDSSQASDAEASQDAHKIGAALTTAAASYLIVKLLFPVRIASCFWLAPRCSHIFGTWAGPWSRRVAARWSKKQRGSS